MTNVRRFTLEELALHPGTYFNPQTEIMIVVDDSPEVDHELFDMDEYEATDWVQITEDTPVDEHKRDDLIERFQLAHQIGEAACRTSDAQVASVLHAAGNEKAAFELIAAAAVGAGLLRWQQAMKALEEAGDAPA